VLEPQQLRQSFGAAVSGSGGALASADSLCAACVDLLAVDGASISVMYEGMTRGTFGSSGAMSRRLDELQFTFGEGPCLEAVATRQPVLVSDLNDASEQRWPAFREALLESGISGVFALPIRVASDPIGALDLYRADSGALAADVLAGALVAAELAALPLLGLISADVDWAALGDEGTAWDELASLERVEVYQATGMIMEQTGVSAAEALVRLRGYAYGHGLTASEVAWELVERRLSIGAGADRSEDEV
jgi:hypothetical protein